MLQAWNVTNINGNRVRGEPKRIILEKPVISDMSSESQVVSPEKKKKKTQVGTFQGLLSKFEGRDFKVWKSGDTIKYPKLQTYEEYLMIFKYKGDVSFYIKGQDKILRKQKEEVSDKLVIVGVARDVDQKERNYSLFINKYSKAFGLFHESSSDSSDESSDINDDEGSVESVKEKKSVRAILRNLKSESSDNEEEESDEETNGK